MVAWHNNHAPMLPYPPTTNPETLIPTQHSWGFMCAHRSCIIDIYTLLCVLCSAQYPVFSYRTSGHEPDRAKKKLMLSRATQPGLNHNPHRSHHQCSTNAGVFSDATEYFFPLHSYTFRMLQSIQRRIPPRISLI